MSSLWVFGYGSLVWRPGFEYSDSKVGYITGYSRRFWQGNDVHRGSTDKLGRVVTLIEDEDEVTWGRAFEMKDVESCREYLDHREAALGGYATRIAKFTPQDPKEEPMAVLVYIALPSNSLYLGPNKLSKVAEEIAESSGNCGPNVEYLAKLAAFMRLNVPDVWDEHLFTLEALVKIYLQKHNPSLLHYFDDALIEDKNIFEDFIKNRAIVNRQDESNERRKESQPLHFTDFVPSRTLRCVKK